MSDFFKLYQKLTADQIRERLVELAAEEHALAVLLKSKLALERERAKRKLVGRAVNA
jgi:hypothetical protein